MYLCVGVLTESCSKGFGESLWAQNFMHDESASWINDAESKLEDTAQAINNKCNWKSPRADKLHTKNGELKKKTL